MHSDMRILVVEDDPDAQAIVDHVLSYLSIPIDVVSDAEEAAQYLFDSGISYTAVIIDLALPGKDGWELLSQIQSNVQTAHLPCVAVTAFHTAKLREEALLSGFSAYFSKPIDIPAFVEEFEVILR